MNTTYYVNADGFYLGGWVGEHVAPDGGIAVPTAPNDARQVWNGSAWTDPPSSYQKELTELNNSWQLQVEAYSKSFALAALSDGPSEEAKKAAIHSAYQADKLENAAARAALKIKYGIGGV